MAPVSCHCQLVPGAGVQISAVGAGVVGLVGSGSVGSLPVAGGAGEVVSWLSAGGGVCERQASRIESMTDDNPPPPRCAGSVSLAAW